MGCWSKQRVLVKGKRLGDTGQEMRDSDGEEGQAAGLRAEQNGGC